MWCALENMAMSSYTDDHDGHRGEWLLQYSHNMCTANVAFEMDVTVQWICKRDVQNACNDSRRARRRYREVLNVEFWGSRLA